MKMTANCSHNGEEEGLHNADDEDIEATPIFYVNCKPDPDAFNPCQDVMGTDVLRAFSWVIATFAIIGNVFQLVILLHSKQKSVYKLLMYNLGISNLLMGVYLLVLCCVDAYTLAEYHNYARAWQYEGGCQAFGFLAVFATSLSVCSLVLITVQRFLLVIFALQVENQMHSKHAKYCIAASWFYSFVVAVLPSAGLVSSYSQTAICLPMDVYERIAEGYVVWLLIAYLLAFLMISCCYIRMYKKIKEVRPMSANNTADTKVAKRMGLVIFSNFLCWLPISFAGLLSMYSGVAFNVSVAKFLIVFIFPLNACTNPFLYAIFTNVFGDDTISLLNVVGLCKNTNKVNSKQSDRLLSCFKSKKHRADTNTLNCKYVKAPSKGCTLIYEINVKAETDFGSQDTPLRVMIEPVDHENNHLQHATNDYDDVRSCSSCSTRGLPEDYKQRADIPCSAPAETTTSAVVSLSLSVRMRSLTSL